MASPEATPEAGPVIHARDHAVNVAATVHVQRQDISLGATARTVEVQGESNWSRQYKDSNNDITQTTINNTYNYTTLPLGRPRNPAAHYIEQSFSPGPRAPTWDYKRGTFVSAENCARQKDELENYWNQSLRFAKELKEEILAHEDEEVLRSRPKFNRLQLEEAKESTRQALLQARKYYSQAYRNHSKVAVDIRTLGGHLPVLFTWLDSLYSYEHSVPICDVLRVFLLAAIKDQSQPDVLIALTAEALSNFTDQTNYMELSAGSRMMMDETVDIFVHLTKMFKLMLSMVGSRLEKKAQAVDAEMQTVNAMLINANDHARNRDKVDPDSNSAHLIPHQDQNLDSLGFEIIDLQLRLFAAQAKMQMTLRGGKSDYLGLSTTSQATQALANLDMNTHRVNPGSFTPDLEEGLQISSVLNYLTFDSALIAADLDSCAVKSHGDTKPLERVSALTRRKAFQEWLKEKRQSSAIYVRGTWEQKEHLITPLSHLCAAIGKQYSKESGFIVLTYFCNLHCGLRDEEANAATMLARLIGQLLSCPDIERVYQPAWIDKNLSKKIKKKDVKTLCRILRTLLRELRPFNLVIFGLVDGISSYEGGARNKDTTEVLETLHQVVEMQRTDRRKKQDRLVFKLMVTDGIFAWKKFRQAERMEVGETMDNNSTRLSL